MSAEHFCAFALFTFVGRLLLFCAYVYEVRFFFNFFCFFYFLFFWRRGAFFCDTPRFALFHSAYLLLLYLDFHFTLALNAASSGVNVFDLFCGNLATQKQWGAEQQSEMADSHKSVSSSFSFNPLAIWMNSVSSAFWLPLVFVYLKNLLTRFIILALLKATVTERTSWESCCTVSM